LNLPERGGQNELQTKGWGREKTLQKKKQKTNLLISMPLERTQKRQGLNLIGKVLSERGTARIGQSESHLTARHCIERGLVTGEIGTTKGEGGKVKAIF